jgi:hypothetical protein
MSLNTLVVLHRFDLIEPYDISPPHLGRPIDKYGYVIIFLDFFYFSYVGFDYININTVSNYSTSIFLMKSNVATFVS